MELLTSNIPPLKTENRDFASCFEELIQQTDHLRIATGYVSADAMTELKKIIEANERPTLELLIGMHYYEGFSRVQYDAAVYLDEFLQDKDMGGVKVATVFKFHGKLYSFQKNNTAFAGILGSSNLNCILQGHRNYETDLLVTDVGVLKQLDALVSQLCNRVGTSLQEISEIKIIESNTLLEDHDRVEAVAKETLASIWASRSDVIFPLPIKGDEAPNSNLNAFFGRGRVNQRGFVKPRHWYEVEVIVPKSITDHGKYPKAGYPNRESVITVYTDDGWRFNCKISGQNSKNFRSEDDLKILGKWLKGRLENSGSLKIGEPVTDAVLQHYGRNTIDLIATDDPQIWLLDFGVKHESLK
ncbi:MAG: NgoFVII family restriction endonuclease [Deltaproteobacteria bacterium]|nr:NgoFVII family restriction endonuclease [Deltaproteobacteria bacterium]